MAINDLFPNEESMQYFPQPSMPESSYETTTWSYTMQDDGYMEVEDEQNEVNHHIIGALRESLEEIDIKGKELFRKIFLEGDMEIPLGRLAREAIGDSRANDLLKKIAIKVGKKMKARKDEDSEVVERGASIDEELTEKLERFKVKTVNIGGVVKDVPK